MTINFRGMFAASAVLLLSLNATVCNAAADDPGLATKSPAKAVAQKEPRADTPAVTNDKPEPGFRSLFDGKTLKGWEGNQKMFRVADGMIIAGTVKQRIPHNEFLCSRQKFGDFELRLQARMVGDGKNAGIQFRSKRIPDHHEVIGYQCDMGDMRGKSIWGWLYDESRRRKFLAESKDSPPHAAGRWHDLVIRCQGTHIQIHVDGKPIVDYREADKKIARDGILGLQIHGGPPAEAHYRHIRIRQLN